MTGTGKQCRRPFSLKHFSSRTRIPDLVCGNWRLDTNSAVEEGLLYPEQLLTKPVL